MRKTTKQRGYGDHHRRLRRRLEPVVAQGRVNCSRCGLPIRPEEPWDLDHDDEDRSRYLGPSHASCNRGAKRQPFVRAQPESLSTDVDLSLYGDDPEKSIFWGPPCEEGGRPLVWSRHWFDWRPEELEEAS